MLRVVRTVARILAVYAIVTGLLGVPVGLFVGPELLIAAVLHLVVGMLLAWLASWLGNRQVRP